VVFGKIMSSEPFLIGLCRKFYIIINYNIFNMDGVHDEEVVTSFVRTDVLNFGLEVL